jgi:hypothetical protein
MKLCLFFKDGEQKGKTGLVWGLVLVGRRRIQRKSVGG